MPHSLIQDINIFATYGCNSRCTNCFIWKNKVNPNRRAYLNDAQMARLIADPVFQRCPNIGFAGGEPTISPFFWQFLSKISSNKHITITTNALSSKKLLSHLRTTVDRQRYLIQVSLDGLEGTHDQIRGVPGSFRKTMKFLNELKALGVESLISFTINQFNHRQLGDCYNEAIKLGAKFSARMAYSGGAYQNKDAAQTTHFTDQDLDHLQQQIQEIIFHELETPNHSPEKLVFLNNIVGYYNGNHPKVDCYALKSGVVIDLYGNVFPNCPVVMRSIGNVRKRSLSHLMNNAKAHQLRQYIHALKCSGCWNDCQVITNISFDQKFFQKEYQRLKIANLAVKNVPAKIDFNEGTQSYLLDGWYLPEGDDKNRFCWTKKDFSIIMPQKIHKMVIFANAPYLEALSTITLKVKIPEVNFEKSITIDNTPKFYTIQLPDPIPNYMPCFFELNQSYCPKSAGTGNDIRNLGLVVSQIQFEK